VALKMRRICFRSELTTLPSNPWLAGEGTDPTLVIVSAVSAALDGSMAPRSEQGRQVFARQ